MVAGEKPTDTPSLADDAAEFKKLNDELFGDGSGVHSVGKGKVYAGQNAAATLKALNVAPDFDHTQAAERYADSVCASQSRLTLTSTSWTTATIATRRWTRAFRVTGKAPELWYAETGKAATCFVQHRRWPHHGASPS